MKKITNVFNIYCLCLIYALTSHKITCAPQDVYSYANKPNGVSPIEDHSQHLAHVAAAYQQTDQNYNNYLDVSVLQ